MKTMTGLLVAVLLATAAPARAQTLDLATVKCKDFVSSDKETVGLLLMWLTGYYSDEEKTVVDFDKMKVQGARLGAYCAKNPDNGLLAAAEEVMSE